MQGKLWFDRLACETFEPYDFQYQRKDGSVFVGETVSTPVKDRSGQTIGFVAIIRDVTQQRQLQQEYNAAQLEVTYREVQLQQFVKHMPAAVAMFDTQMRYLFHSDRWVTDYGLQNSNLLGKHHYDLPGMPERWRANYQTCLGGEVLRNDQDAFVREDGSTDWLKWEMRPWYEPSGRIGGLLMVTEVITPQKQAQLKLQASESRFKAFMDHSFAVTFMKDAAGRYTYVNQRFEQFAGLSQSLLGKTDEDWLPADVAHHVQQHDRTVLETGKASQLFETIPAQDGTPNDWMICKFPCPTMGEQTALGGVAINVTEQKRIERELSKEKELAQITLQSIGDAVITTDAWGDITYLNPVAERLTGWPLCEAKGTSLSRVFHIVDESTRERVGTPADEVLRTGRTAGLINDIALIDKDGNEYSIVDSAAPIRDDDGTVIGVVLVFHDATESRTLSQQLAWQASHDELTGLKNRRYFELKLSETLEDFPREHVLCFLDLDQFKVVNDTCGHVAGDQLLQQVGTILIQNVRAADVVARLGGDEFGILLDKCSLENARRVMDLIRQAVQDFRFVWQDKTFGVSVSVGVVEIDDRICNLADALGAADAACYAAKERGRNRIYLYQADDQQLSEQRSQQQWIGRIQQALDENQFQLYQQPIAPAALTLDGVMHHHEILLRLVDATGIVPPMAFIPAAERYGLMPAIDRWVIQAFFSQIKQLQATVPLSLSQRGFKTGFYTLNLSGASINDEQFLPFLKQQIERGSISPEALCFEITETVAVSNLNKAREFIYEIKALGCSFALDDFGSGMSSFGYLQHLAVNYVKIDGSFVRNLLTNEISTSIVEAITKIAHSMGLETIAERVEDLETQRKLQALGVDYVQGYGIGRPAPLADANAVLVP